MTVAQLENPAARWLPGVALAAASLPFVGAGPRNGDVAGYLWQVAAGRPWDRATHAGYVWLASPAVALLGQDRGPLALDLLSVAACALASAAAGWRAPIAGYAVAAVLLPLAAFGEVDPVWIACAAVAVTAPVGVSAALMATAVAVSPAALLALPWVCVARGRDAGWLLGAAALAVAALSLASGGAWWLGERGVLVSELSSLGRVPGTWLAHLPWILVLALAAAADGSWRREALALAPLLLLPADVPGWAVAGVAVARRLDGIPLPRAWLAVGGQAALSLGWVLVDSGRIADETSAIAAAATAVDPERDGVIAPFSAGARLSWVRTGDPYGLRWHPEGRWLRDQRSTWCAEGAPARVWRWDGQALVPADDVAGCP
ncbi:MAG: hypothetical protein H6738_13780 [Alphaproteobacteria bacterium]|nr:hypothetical protein [Alphaproteobacteria bacterium]